MKLLGYLLGACIVLAIVRAAVIVLLIAVALSLIIGALTKPRETLGLVAFLVITNLIQAYPVAMLVGIAVVIVVSIFIRQKPSGDD